MKVAALAVFLFGAFVSAEIANMYCHVVPDEKGWGRPNCSDEDQYDCGQRCSSCVADDDFNGRIGWWRKSDNKCDCYCW
ncbi:hypothetical protein C8034_v006860 [Colletotrichum sidae]|uniref:Secreted protein n=1 Tax=Colletotrichum sidae TaxID=1347389 RepID=A0A4R8T5B1_9PEZI|nr:hypothetical protein C8034_v006860 [Colletotrichum sidae]